MQKCHFLYTLLLHASSTSSSSSTIDPEKKTSNKKEVVIGNPRRLRINKKKPEQKQNTNIQTNHLFFDHHQCCSNKIYWSKMNETSFMSRHSHCQFRNSASHIACIYIHIESPCFRFLFAKIAALIICCSSAFHFTAAKTFISLTVPHRIDMEYVEVAQLHIKHHISIWYVLMHENNSHFRRHGRMDVYIYMFLLRANTVAM